MIDEVLDIGSSISFSQGRIAHSQDLRSLLRIFHLKVQSSEPTKFKN